MSTRRPFLASAIAFSILLTLLALHFQFSPTFTLKLRGGHVGEVDGYGVHATESQRARNEATGGNEGSHQSANGTLAADSSAGEIKEMLSPDTQIPANPTTIPGSAGREIVRFSMLFGHFRGAEDPVLKRAMDTQIAYGERWGYETHILRRQIQGKDEYGDVVFSKPLFMLSFIIAELAKPEEHRAKWILWFDADTVVTNPNIPLEIFLPPDDYPHVHMLAAKDGAGLNIGVFFLRVHEWSVALLTQTTTLVHLRPEIIESRESGNNDQDSMRWVLEQPAFSDNIVYMSHHWFNAFHFFMYSQGEEPFTGDLLLHWAGDSPEGRSETMQEWLDKLEQEPEKHYIPLEETYHYADIEAFWNKFRNGKKVVDDTWSLLKEYEDLGTQRELDKGIQNLLKTLPPPTTDLARLLKSEPYEIEKIDEAIALIMREKRELEKAKEREVQAAQREESMQMERQDANKSSTQPTEEKMAVT